MIARPERHTRAGDPFPLELASTLGRPWRAGVGLEHASARQLLEAGLGQLEQLPLYCTADSFHWTTDNSRSNHSIMEHAGSYRLVGRAAVTLQAEG